MSMKLTCLRPLIRMTSLAALVVATASCGDVVRSSRSPVMLIVNSLTAGSANTFNSDVITASGSVFDDLATASLTVIPKNTTAPTSSNNDVTITRYRVEYSRTDGRNREGVDVPYSFDGAATITIPAGVTNSVVFEAVRHVAKKETPLVQLITDINVISTIAKVTFYGQDQVGNELSATGSILINFLNLGD